MSVDGRVCATGDFSIVSTIDNHGIEAVSSAPKCRLMGSEFVTREMFLLGFCTLYMPVGDQSRPLSLISIDSDVW